MENWSPQHLQVLPGMSPSHPIQPRGGTRVREARAPPRLPNLCCPRLPAPALTYGPHCASHNGNTSC